jgi:hypothetical protein
MSRWGGGTCALSHMRNDICAPDFCATYVPRYLRSIITPRHMRANNCAPTFTHPTCPFLKFSTFFEKYITSRVRKCRGAIISAHMLGRNY